MGEEGELCTLAEKRVNIQVFYKSFKGIQVSQGNRKMTICYIEGTVWYLTVKRSQGTLLQRNLFSLILHLTYENVKKFPTRVFLPCNSF